MANFLQLDNLPGGHGGGSGGGGTGNIGLNTAFTNVTATVNSSGISINAAGYAGTGTTFTNVTATLNSVGLQFNASGYAGTATTMAAGLSATLNSVGLNLSVGPYITTGRASTDAVGLNTAQTNVTWTVNSSGLSFNAAGYAGTGTAKTGNISVTLNSVGLSVNAANLAGTGTSATNASITLNTAGLAISVGAPGVGTLSFYEPTPFVATGGSLTFDGSTLSHLVGFNAPANISASFMRVIYFIATNTSNATIATTNASLNASCAVGSTFNAVLYTLGTGANSMSLLSYASSSGSASVLNSISVTGGGTQHSYTQIYSYPVSGGYSSASGQYSLSTDSYSFRTSLFQSATGTKYFDIPFGVSMSPGQYWLLLGMATGSSTNSTGVSGASNAGPFYKSHIVIGGPNIAGLRNIGESGSSTFGIPAGAYSQAGVGTTDSIAFSNISSVASNARFWCAFERFA